MKASRALNLAREYGACSDAIAWLESLPPDADAWQKCERGDWMLWFASHYGVDHKLIVTAGCRCARLALSYLTSGEDRPRIAIEAAEAWTRGEATIEQVRAAANAAYAAANAAYAASNAAYAASNAASNAANAASNAASTAAYAAVYAAYASTAADAALVAMQKRCADIVREVIKL